MSTLTQKNLDSVFHAYDIRGLDPQEMDEEFFEALGKAFATFLNAKKIAIGNDIRRTGPKYKQAFIKGATSLGCDVVDIGEIATEMLYFAVGSDESFDGGVTITASHNPSGWNGCKMVGKYTAALSEDWGLPEVKDLMLKNKFGNTAKKGKVSKKNIYPEYKQKMLSFLEDVEIKPLKIVVDAGNGIGGKIFDYVFGELPLTVHKMYYEPDDTFPNHVPNPIEYENVKDIIKETVDRQADIGIAIDGDADRVFFIDNKGRYPDGVYVGSIFTEYFLKDNPGSKIILDPRVVGPVEGEVEKGKGIGIRCKAGHAFFKQKMRAEKALFGSENSSHFYFKDYYYADSGMITVAIMLKMLSEDLDFDERLDALYANYPKSGEVNYEVDDPKAVIAKVEKHFKEKYPDVNFDYIDGISVEFDNWRFNLRPSNTQPLIRLNVEGKTKDLVVHGFREVENLIGGRKDNEPALKELL